MESGLENIGVYIQKSSHSYNVHSSFLERLAYIISITGMVGDQISTRLGLSLPNIYETNHFVASLMSQGLWLSFDLLMLSFTLLLPFFLMRFTNIEERNTALIFPFLFGCGRIVATISNLSLFFSHF